MIKDLNLDDHQEVKLAWFIEEATGRDFCEVTHVQSETDEDGSFCYKAFYAYEDAECRERYDSIYFRAMFWANSDSCTDFEEVTF